MTEILTVIQDARKLYDQNMIMRKVMDIFKQNITQLFAQHEMEVLEHDLVFYTESYPHLNEIYRMGYHLKYRGIRFYLEYLMENDSYYAFVQPEFRAMCKNPASKLTYQNLTNLQEVKELFDKIIMNEPELQYYAEKDKLGTENPEYKDLGFFEKHIKSYGEFISN